MIAKKVKSTGGGSKKGKISRLVDYITKEEKDKNIDKQQNKIDYYGSRGFICDDLISQKAEMIALASDAPKCTNPITHWVMSWQENERPNRDQVDQAINILLEELDMADRQVIYAAHQDTDNYHVHIVINRVHPDTLKAPNNFRDVELGHKAVARIEQIQGWQSQQRARYQVIDGQTQRVQHPPQIIKQPVGQIAQQIESHQGIKSAERIGIESGADLIRAAHSWSDLHESLAERGMRYEQYGSGAYLYVGDVKLKASSVGRDCSLPQLKKRLGEYQPPGILVVTKVEPQLMDGLSKERQKYIKQRFIYETARKESRIALKEKQLEELRELQVDQRTRREKLVTGDWRGRGELLNALRSEIATEQEQERDELGERQWGKMEDAKVEPFPDLEDWLSRENQRQIQVDAERQSEVQEHKQDFGMSI